MINESRDRGILRFPHQPAPKSVVDAEVRISDTASVDGTAPAAPKKGAVTVSLAHQPKNWPGDALPDGTPLISLEDAKQRLSRDERFMATVYALRTLLVEKGIVRPEELDYHFRQWAQKQIRSGS